METPSAFMPGRHRASSDPLSRGGAFLDGAGLLQQELNPFEQSFGPQASTSKPTDGTLTAGGRRARSTSPSALLPRATPGGLQRLPPLSLMQTPGGELSAFNWGVDSLRTGPLSPALLNGPTGTSALFESSLRTGLTPFVASGAPNGHAGGGVSFPPPSPATAALFAMMTNNTPGTSDAAALAGGGPRPHEGLNEANSFDASFAQANSTQHSKLRNSLRASDSPVDMNGGVTQPSSTAGMTTRSSSNVSVAPPPPPPGVAYPPQGPPGSHVYYPPGPHAHTGPPGAPPPGYAFPPHAPPPQPHPHAHSQGPPPPPGAPPHPHFTGPPGQLGFTAPPPPTNPLDLLTQASFHNDDAVAAAAALSGLATPGGGFPAAAVLAAAQQQGAAGGIMPGSTVTGGPGAVGTGPANGGPAIKDSSPAPSAGSSAGGGTGRAKRGAAAAGAAVSSVPAKRARKPTAAAAAAAEEMSLGLDEEEVATTATKKAPAKRGGRKAAAAVAAAKKEDPDTDGMSVSANGSVPPEAGGSGEYQMEGMEMPSGPSKGGRGRKKDTGETEEEKRRNFLERNRQAALKCRQRKKAWLQSLQTKVELLTTDNDALQTTVNNLKEEVNSLRAILAAHASCPVALGNVPPAPLPSGMSPIDPRRAAMPGMPPGSAPPPHAGHPPASIPPGYAPRAVYQ
ncbi:putative BZIP transcription factor AtfA [Rhodotorula toruloides]|nr:putative BZIP transcription factor AtfA [Rhodotorula toruloides]